MRAYHSSLALLQRHAWLSKVMDCSRLDDPDDEYGEQQAVSFRLMLVFNMRTSIELPAELLTPSPPSSLFAVVAGNDPPALLHGPGPLTLHLNKSMHMQKPPAQHPVHARQSPPALLCDASPADNPQLRNISRHSSPPPQTSKSGRSTPDHHHNCTPITGPYSLANASRVAGCAEETDPSSQRLMKEKNFLYAADQSDAVNVSLPVCAPVIVPGSPLLSPGSGNRHIQHSPRSPKSLCLPSPKNPALPSSIAVDGSPNQAIVRVASGTSACEGSDGKSCPSPVSYSPMRDGQHRSPVFDLIRESRAAASCFTFPSPPVAPASSGTSAKSITAAADEVSGNTTVSVHVHSVADAANTSLGISNGDATHCSGSSSCSRQPASPGDQPLNPHLTSSFPGSTAEKRNLMYTSAAATSVYHSPNPADSPPVASTQETNQAPQSSTLSPQPSFSPRSAAHPSRTKVTIRRSVRDSLRLSTASDAVNLASVDLSMFMAQAEESGTATHSRQRSPSPKRGLLHCTPSAWAPSASSTMVAADGVTPRPSSNDRQPLQSAAPPRTTEETSDRNNWAAPRSSIASSAPTNWQQANSPSIWYPHNQAAHIPVPADITAGNVRFASAGGCASSRAQGAAQPGQSSSLRSMGVANSSSQSSSLAGPSSTASNSRSVPTAARLPDQAPASGPYGSPSLFSIHEDLEHAYHADQARPWHRGDANATNFQCADGGSSGVTADRADSAGSSMLSVAPAPSIRTSDCEWSDTDSRAETSTADAAEALINPGDWGLPLEGEISLRDYLLRDNVRASAARRRYFY